MELIHIASEVLVLFILLVILGKKGKQVHDRILILWLILILVNTQGFNLQSANPYHFFIEFSSAVVFLHGPIIWLYFLALSSKKWIFKIEYLLHLLPFSINLLLILPALFEQRLASFTETERNILLVAKLTSIILYTVITIVHINWFKKTIRDYFSNTGKKELQWLQLLLYGVLMVWVLAVVSQLVVHLSNQPIMKENEDLVVNLAVSLLVIFIGYYGFRQGAVFQNFPVQPEKYPVKDPQCQTPDIPASQIPEMQRCSTPESQVLPEPKRPGQKNPVKNSGEAAAKQSEIPEQERITPNGSDRTVKYKKSGLDKVKLEQLASSLKLYMEHEQPYLEPELTLLQLARAVNLSANDLSQVINEQFGVNFFDFINSYRVEAFKKSIANGEMNNKTMIGIAMEAGFNSKASFNRAFKKMTGQTPTEYSSGLEMG